MKNFDEDSTYLQVQTSQTPKILLDDCFVNGCASTNTLTIVVCRICPPISLGFHVTQDPKMNTLSKYYLRINLHVLNWSRQIRHFPWDIGFPTTPGFTQMLQNDSSLVLKRSKISTFVKVTILLTCRTPSGIMSRLKRNQLVYRSWII